MCLGSSKGTQRQRSAWVWLWVSVCVVLLDQWAKHWVVSHFSYGVPWPVLPFLNVTLAYNTGAAFSLLGDAGGWQVYFFVTLSAVMSVVFAVWLVRTPRTCVMRALGLALILGGALGNGIDRVRWGSVVDYVDVYLRGWHFATFNLADVAICVGAFLLIVSVLRQPSAA